MPNILSQMMRLPFDLTQATVNQMQDLLAQSARSFSGQTPNSRWPNAMREFCPGSWQDLGASDSSTGDSFWQGSDDLLNSLGVEFPKVANGPIEKVLAFNNDERIRLTNFPAAPYFSSRGPLTDLQGNVLPGSRVETTFPVQPSSIDAATTWPRVQPPPFDRPPLDPTTTEGNGYSKQAYFFSEGDSFVTVGPSLPKISPLKNGGAQFWVGSIGVIAQGTGQYEGAKGVTTYVGSGYLPVWPKTFEEQVVILEAGFRALVGTYLKVVLRPDQAR